MLLQRQLDYDTVWKPHATVAAVVERDGRYLCIEERIRGRILLNQPAGHLEPGESVMEAAVREAREESGHTIELEALIGIYQWRSPGSGKHFLRFAFAGKSLAYDPDLELDEGIIRAIWLTPDEVRAREADLRSPMVLAGIEAHASGVRAPLDLVKSYLADEVKSD